MEPGPNRPVLRRVAFVEAARILGGQFLPYAFLSMLTHDSVFFVSSRSFIKSGASLFMKLRVDGSAVGARHAVPLQLWHYRNTLVFVEFARDLKRICETSGFSFLNGGSLIDEI